MNALQPGEQAILDPEHQLLLVGEEYLPLVWPHVIPLLSQGKEHWESFATMESLYLDVSSGTRQLWTMNYEGEFVMALFTEIVSYPTTRVLNILWLGGSGLEVALYLFLDFIELWAIRQGVSSVQVFGRKGWVRKLKRRGYEQTKWVVSKDLTNIKEH